MVNGFAKFSGYNSRLITNSLVDAFLCYLSGLLQEVMKKRPDVLRSKESLTFNEVLEYRSRSNLLEYMIDKKINRLSYGGLSAIEEYVQSVFSIEVFSDAEIETSIKMLIEARNINVHNRGFVNRTFVERTRGLEFDRPSIGKRFHLNWDLLVKLSEDLVRAALYLDGDVAKKYGLRRKKYVTWAA